MVHICQHHPASDSFFFTKDGAHKVKRKSRRKEKMELLTQSEASVVTDNLMSSGGATIPILNVMQIQQRRRHWSLCGVSPLEVVHNVFVRQPRRSKVVQSPRTNDPQFPLQPQLIVHAVENPPTQGTCALSAFVQPSVRPSLCTPMWCLLASGPPSSHWQSVHHHLQSATVLCAAYWQVHVADLEIRTHPALLFLCRCAP